MSDWTTPGGAPPPPGGSPLPPAPGSQPGGWPSAAPGYAPTGQWRSTRGLATAITILLIVTAVVAVLVLLLGFAMRSALVDVSTQTGDFGALSDAEDAINAFYGSFSFFFLLYAATGICFVVWMYRVAKNHELLGRPGTTFAPGFAIGGWFIPLASLVIPGMQMAQLWQGSDPSVGRGDPAWKRVAQSPLVWLWWILYVVGQVLFFVGISQIGQTSSGDTEVTVFDFLEDLDSVKTGVVVVALAMASLIAAAVLGILVVRRLSERQQAASQALGVGSGGYAGSPVVGAWSAAAPGAASAASASPAAWHPDPTGRYEQRYWDGSRWTEHVSRGGQQFTDPV